MPSEHDWKCGGVEGLADCELCGARNVSCRFRLRQKQTRATLLICRICRDNFYPAANTPTIFSETPDVESHWEQNRTEGKWPFGVQI